MIGGNKKEAPAGEKAQAKGDDFQSSIPGLKGKRRRNEERRQPTTGFKIEKNTTQEEDDAAERNRAAKKNPMCRETWGRGGQNQRESTMQAAYKQGRSAQEGKKGITWGKETTTRREGRGKPANR